MRDIPKSPKKSIVHIPFVRAPYERRVGSVPCERRYHCGSFASRPARLFLSPHLFALPGCSTTARVTASVSGFVQLPPYGATVRCGETCDLTVRLRRCCVVCTVVDPARSNKVLVGALLELARVGTGAVLRIAAGTQVALEPRATKDPAS